MFRMPLKFMMLMVIVQITGCDSGSQIREYTVDREQPEVLTSELIRDRYQKRGSPFRWKVPNGWESARNDQFSTNAWQAGPDDAPVRITVSSLPGQAGLEPQFARWAGQINYAESDPAALMAKVEAIALEGAQGQWIALEGPSETILGMIVPHQDELWVVKLRGENEAAEAVKTSFRTFCESWRVN